MSVIDRKSFIPVIEKDPKRQDPEVLEKKPQRRFTTKHKFGILAEVGTCAKTRWYRCSSAKRRPLLFSTLLQKACKKKQETWRCI